MKHQFINIVLFIGIIFIGPHLVIADNGEIADDAGVAELLASMTEGGAVTEQGVTISGFFDLEFNKLDTSNSTMSPLISDEGTFSNSHLNVYLDSQVSSKVRFFSEVRLLHQPFTLFTEENLASRFQGSLLIERAWVDWNYRNELNIRGGKFLTPYGIWNIEHGGPILISTRTPLLLRKQIFPEAMTGLQVYGKIFPADFQISYHAWIGNGKGPTSAIQDNDDHKSVGGRVAVRLPTNRKIELGVSAYTGHVEKAELIPSEPVLANIRKVFMSEGNMPLLMKLVGNGFTAQGEAVDGYIDRALGFDLSFELSNFEIQGEWVVNSVDPFKKITPEFKELGGYGQIAYGIWTSAGKFTPFVRAGFSDPNDEFENEIGELRIFTFGLNYKPTVGVALKTEFHLHQFDTNDRDFPMFANSLSVAF